MLVPWAISNTVPFPLTPPVVPKRSPLLFSITAPDGDAPLVALKDARLMSVLGTCLSSSRHTSKGVRRGRRLGIIRVERRCDQIRASEVSQQRGSAADIVQFSQVSRR